MKKVFVSKLSVFLCFLASTFVPCFGQTSPERAELLTIPNVSDNPLDIKVISQKEQDGVVVEELYINGAPFQGKPTTIYAWYAHPLAKGKYPGVVQLHGSGLQKLVPDSAIEYAKHNYACISIDWAGPDWKSEGKLRQGPRSEFESSGHSAKFIPNSSDDPKHGHFVAVDPAQSSITNGVRFVRRAFQFLRSRPEVDADKLCLSGMSAGAHLSLLVLGVESDIKAAAVKYGSGFIQELNWGGYYGPLSLSSLDGATKWLSILDPKYGFSNVKAHTLFLSGTDDIFFFMPAVLASWRAIPSPKALLMRPNDSHTQVGNEEIPRQWFDFVLKGSPEWPVLDIPAAEEKNGAVNLSVAVRGNVSKVTFWYKRMPVESFNFKKKNPTSKEQDVEWKMEPAQKNGDYWTASIPALSQGEQLISYALAEDASGTQASSDTVEVPDYPKWGRNVSALTTSHSPY